MLATTLVALAGSVPAAPFAGKFVAGVGDTEFLRLVDIGRRQQSSAEIEFQSIMMLYDGDWDGLIEGPGWGAWWTQNSYGTQMTSLPFMEDATLAATAHSNAWWFNSIGNGSTAGLDPTGTNAPDGCLCDAARPVVGNGGCYFKQGDGDVPRHDWTMEESLSAVVMEAERLLITRNMTGIAHYLPLFLRTTSMLEERRDEASGYTAFVTGPSTNLLAPSFGGGPNGTRSYLAGVSVTYTAALNRMIELALLAGNPEPSGLVADLRDRVRLNLKGITEHFIVGKPGARYLVRSKDPADGTLHGVLGQQRFGYWEASPNHDAVFHRIVNDTIAAEIMAVTDQLGEQIRPNVFMLPNTDAGGGVGYDDMLCGTGCSDADGFMDGKQKGGIYEYGTWVNGGVWSTQEARAIMAYSRTNRTAAAADSMRAMTNKFASRWAMDAPLRDFGQTTWKSTPTMLTHDAFGHGTAMVRGLFEYLYTATTLALVPHLPDSVTALEQKFPIRWGAYRLMLSVSGVRSCGIASATVNGVAVKAGHHSITDAQLLLQYAEMPPPSAAAAAATDSDVSTAGDVIAVTIQFKTPTPKGGSAPTKGPTRALAAKAASWPAPPHYSGVLPPGFALHFDAATLASGAGAVQPNAPVHRWESTAPAGGLPSVVATVAAGGAAPRLRKWPEGFSVDFDGIAAAMTGSIELGQNLTIIAVARDRGTSYMYTPIFGVDTDKGLDIVPKDCATGNPIVSDVSCHATGVARAVAIDYSGSGDYGHANVSGTLAVMSVGYQASDAASFSQAKVRGRSHVNGCPEQYSGVSVSVLSSGNSAMFRIGFRGDPLQYHRFFNGSVFELVVYNRSLSDAEQADAGTFLATKYGMVPQKCNPAPDIDCRSFNQAGVGLLPTEVARLRKFLGLQTTAVLQQTVPRAMALAALDYDAGFGQRCALLVNGTLDALPTLAQNTKSLTDMLVASRSLFVGLNNSLVNRYAASLDPVAKRLAGLWAEAGGSLT